MDKTSDPATGVVSEGTKHVIYVYEKDVTPEEKKGNVDVTYVTEDGKVLEATTDVVKDGEIGTEYTTEKKNLKKAVTAFAFTRLELASIAAGMQRSAPMAEPRRLIFIVSRSGVQTALM